MTNPIYVLAFSACHRHEFYSLEETENQKKLRELCVSLGMKVIHEHKATVRGYEFAPDKSIDEFQRIVAGEKNKSPRARIMIVIDNLLLFRMNLCDERYATLQKLGQVIDRLTFERDAEAYFDACSKGGFPPAE